MKCNYVYALKRGFTSKKPNSKLVKLNTGFYPMYEDNIFERGWAKQVSVPFHSPIGSWIKSNLEAIYRQECNEILKKGGGDAKSEWIDKFIEEGLEFTPEGAIIENETLCQPIIAQLCVLDFGTLRRCLFLNVGGAIEFYDSETLLACVPQEINDLISCGALVKKKFKNVEKSQKAVKSQDIEIPQDED